MDGEGKVKYNFKAESPRELSLQKVCKLFSSYNISPCVSVTELFLFVSIQGDIVALTRQIDKNWFEGVKDDKIGIFPVSYIEVMSHGVL